MYKHKRRGFHDVILISKVVELDLSHLSFLQLALKFRLALES